MKNIFGQYQKHTLPRQGLALMLPVFSCLIELLFWPYLKGLTWILFYPAVFFAGWLGGFYFGLTATAISLGLGWFVFSPPQYTFLKGSFALFLSAFIFTATAVLISYLHGRMRKTERELREASEETTRLYEKTLELDKIKTGFFANVSHELRTPLTLILGPVESLLSKGPSPESRGTLEVIRRNARILLKQVNDLLDMARLEAGKVEVTYSEIDLAKLMRRIASNFASTAIDRKITLSVELPDTLTVQIDTEKFERIMLNFLSNAFKFTPDGGTVRCTLRKLPEAQTAVIEVADNGPGIPEQYRETVFERFFQIEGEAFRRFGGTGLGLAIVKEFVELQHGTVKVTKAPEGGALFTMEIPVKAPEGVQLTRPPAAPTGPAPLIVVEPVPTASRLRWEQVKPAKPFAAAHGAGPRKPLVLVVEDTPDMRDYVCEVLGPNIQIETAENGRVGLEKTRNLRPDLIVSDIMMPEMSGDQMFRALRADRELEGIPIILLTAKADEELRIELLREGAQDYLIKPFMPEELRAKVRNLLTVKAAESKFRGLLESAQDAIFIVGSDGKICFANQQTVSYFGYSKEELIGQPIEILVPESLRSSHVKLRDQYLREPESKQMGERMADLRGRRKDGSEFPVSIALSPLQTLEGLLITAIVRDITEMKKLSEQAIRAREEAIATISHDLKNPLTAIQTSVALLSARQMSPERREKFIGKTLATVDRASRQMSSLIQDLLDYTKVETHRLAVKKKAEDASSIIREIFDIFEPQARDKLITLREQIGENVTIAFCERSRIVRVLSNLVNNAIKFTPTAGEITILVEQKMGGEVMFSVRDTGPGISPERLPHVFERYWQAEETATKGTGLGLAIARGFVEAHHGKIWVESQVGHGSTFHFLLPGPEKVEKTA